MSKNNRKTEVENIEIQLLIEAIRRFYGFDFRDYAIPYLKSKINCFIKNEKLPSISALQERILRNHVCMDRFLLSLNIRSKGLFQPVHFYTILRTKIIPFLRTYPFIRIWYAGCSSAEEVYSIAILLHEENLYHKTHIYVTNVSENLLKKTKKGIFPLQRLEQMVRYHRQSGGKHSLTDYYVIQKDQIVFQPSLCKNIIFSIHNLATDGSFNEFNVIIYHHQLSNFNKTLQDHILQLFDESLIMFGFLGLSSKEPLNLSIKNVKYEKFNNDHDLYRKIQS